MRCWPVLLLLAIPVLLRGQAPAGLIVKRMAVLVGVAVVVAIHAQSSAQQPPTFEVVSVKPNTSGDPRTGGRLEGTRFSMINETLWRLIGEAYGDPQALTRDRIVGGPSWLDVARFDVDAVAAAPLDRRAADLMLRHVLSERFKLAARVEMREVRRTPNAGLTTKQLVLVGVAVVLATRWTFS